MPKSHKLISCSNNKTIITCNTKIKTAPSTDEGRILILTVVIKDSFQGEVKLNNRCAEVPSVDRFSASFQSRIFARVSKVTAATPVQPRGRKMINCRKIHMSVFRFTSGKLLLCIQLYYALYYAWMQWIKYSPRVWGIVFHHYLHKCFPFSYPPWLYYSFLNKLSSEIHTDKILITACKTERKWQGHFSLKCQLI